MIFSSEELLVKGVALNSSSDGSDGCALGSKIFSVEELFAREIALNSSSDGSDGCAFEEDGVLLASVENIELSGEVFSELLFKVFLVPSKFKSGFSLLAFLFLAEKII